MKFRGNRRAQRPRRLSSPHYWPEVPEDSKVSGGSIKHLCQSAESDKAPARHSFSVAIVAATIPPSAESKITTIPATAEGVLDNSL